MNLPDGWTKKILPGGRREITIPSMCVGVMPRTKELWLKENYPFSIGDIIVIKDRINGPIKECRFTKDGCFLTIESEKDIFWEIIKR